MLARIEIRDFALIEQAVLEPENGLLVISGETGAGKSILIDAIGSLLGGKLSKDMIRHGQSRAVVEALFVNADKVLPVDLANEIGIELSGELILSREINSQGRSLSRINGRMASQTLLRQVSSYMIDIHGQNDHQTIFKPETHLQLLDRFGADNVAHCLTIWKNARISCLDIQRQLRELGSDPSERIRQLDLLEYQINEIENSAIKDNEEEKLVRRQKILSSLERIQEGFEGTLSVISADQDDSAPARLAQACEHLEFPARHIENARKCLQELESMIDQLSVFAGDIREMQEKYQPQPGELERIQSRLELLERLKRKYGGSVSGITEYLKKAKTRRDQLADGEAKFVALRKSLDNEVIKLLDAANMLHQARKKAALSLEKGIAGQLNDLGMKGVRFAVNLNFEPPSEMTIKRKDCEQAEFLISANPGEPLKPLAKIASGGEASRVLLSIKTILADVDNIPVLIFDEIDSGVSGHTAGMVAEKLKQISKHRQVFCITHMAQIAAQADQHVLIEKHSDDKTTSTDLTVLDESDRLSELARLLSGGIADHKARELAVKLIEAARKM